MQKPLFSLIFFSLVFQLALTAQSIKGKVTSESNGKAIEFAIVRHENNPTIWTKTDEDGKFSILGSSSTKLRVAALHFETKRNLTVNSTSNLQVKLEKNALESSTDVFHISFDEVRPGSRIKDVEIEDYFHTFYSKGFHDGDQGSDRASIDTETSIDPGGQSLKVLFPKGAVKTGDSGVDLKLPLSGTTNNNTFLANELYVSYWIKVSDNFDWEAHGGKLPSLGGSLPFSREKEWKGRIMWGPYGTLRFYPELKEGDQSFVPKNLEYKRWWGTEPNNENRIRDQQERTSYLMEDGWHNIELHYVLDNGPGTHGVFEGWVDGQPAAERRLSSSFGYWRGQGNQGITINTLKISAFCGGSEDVYEPSNDEYMWFDEFRVSRQRINEYSKYRGNPLSNKEEIEGQLITVFPNPSESGIFNLSVSSDFEVYNSTGQSILNETGSFLDLSHLPRGVYFVKVNDQVKQLIY